MNNPYKTATDKFFKSLPPLASNEEISEAMQNGELVTGYDKADGIDSTVKGYLYKGKLYITEVVNRESGQ